MVNLLPCGGSGRWSVTALSKNCCWYSQTTRYILNHAEILTSLLTSSFWCYFDIGNANFHQLSIPPSSWYTSVNPNCLSFLTPGMLRWAERHITTVVISCDNCSCFIVLMESDVMGRFSEPSICDLSHSIFDRTSTIWMLFFWSRLNTAWASISGTFPNGSHWARLFNIDMTYSKYCCLMRMPNQAWLKNIDWFQGIKWIMMTLGLYQNHYQWSLSIIIMATISAT